MTLLNTKKARRAVAPPLVALFAAVLSFTTLAVLIDRTAPAAQRAAETASEAEQPVLLGAFRDNFTLLDKPIPAPEETWEDGQGNTLSLADYRGRVVLVNFWATWCGPCVHEMPTLDNLQAELGPDGLVVLTVSEDRGGAKVVAPFMAENKLDNLGIHLDPSGEFARAFNVRGLPTTLLIDRDGRMVGGLEGPAEWDSQEAQVLIKHYLKQPVATSG